MINFSDKELSEIPVVENVDSLENSIQLRIGDSKVKLIASFKNICAVQGATGRSEIQNIMELSQGKLGVVDIATIIFHSIDGKDDRFHTIAQIGEAILKSKKFTQYLSATTGFLALMMDDGKEPGKSEAETE